jgi:hypothetical protein
MKTKKIGNNKFKRSRNRGKGSSDNEVGKKRTFSNIVGKFASYVATGNPYGNSSSEEEVESEEEEESEEKAVSTRAPSTRVTRFTGSYDESIKPSAITETEPREKKRRTSAVSTPKSELKTASIRPSAVSTPKSELKTALIRPSELKKISQVTFSKNTTIAKTGTTKIVPIDTKEIIADPLSLWGYKMFLEENITIMNSLFEQENKLFNEYVNGKTPEEKIKTRKKMDTLYGKMNTHIHDCEGVLEMDVHLSNPTSPGRANSRQTQIRLPGNTINKLKSKGSQIFVPSDEFSLDAGIEFRVTQGAMKTEEYKKMVLKDPQNRNLESMVTNANEIGKRGEIDKIRSLVKNKNNLELVLNLPPTYPVYDIPPEYGDDGYGFQIKYAKSDTIELASAKKFWDASCKMVKDNNIDLILHSVKYKAEGKAEGISNKKNKELLRIKKLSKNIVLIFKGKNKNKKNKNNKTRQNNKNKNKNKKTRRKNKGEIIL